MEYKYRLDKGEALLYSWKATGPVNYEFHAEPDGAPRGYAQTYEKKDGSDAGVGTLTAPFSGIHGWYWENTTDQEMTVTLTAAGFYNMSHEFRDRRARQEQDVSVVHVDSTRVRRQHDASYDSRRSGRHGVPASVGGAGARQHHAAAVDPGCHGTVNGRIPTEGKVATVAAELEAPEGVIIETMQAPAGWKPTPAQGYRIVAITWQADVQRGEFIEVGFVARNPRQGNRIVWTLRQRFADGTVTDWTNGPQGSRPTAVTQLSPMPGATR